MTIYYCPIDREVCTCLCCLQSGCTHDAERPDVLFKCPGCDELVAPRELCGTKCHDCALAEAMPA